MPRLRLLLAVLALAGPAAVPRAATAAWPADHAIATGYAPYHGLGAWVDVYDWSRAYTGGHPALGPSVLATMKSSGVQTLYLQGAKAGSRYLLVDEALLRTWIRTAHQYGIRVVLWYLPTLVSPTADLNRIKALYSLPMDSLAVDIESRIVPDPADRSRRLVWLSHNAKLATPRRVLGAIVVPPVAMEIVNPNYWPGFPWAKIAPDYSVWQPMAYWSYRSVESGWKDGYRYTKENVLRVRRNIGNRSARVHPIGTPSNVTDIRGMVRAVRETSCVGGSVYDWRTTPAYLRPYLTAFRR